MDQGFLERIRAVAIVLSQRGEGECKYLALTKILPLDSDKSRPSSSEFSPTSSQKRLPAGEIPTPAPRSERGQAALEKVGGSATTSEVCGSLHLAPSPTSQSRRLPRAHPPLSPVFLRSSRNATAASELPPLTRPGLICRFRLLHGP